MKKLILIFIIFMQSTNSSAGLILVKDYLKQKDSQKAFFDTYINGLGTGMSWSISGEKNPFYCPPENLALTTENYKHIIEAQIRIDKNELIPIELTLKDGLQRTFPCKK